MTIWHPKIDATASDLAERIAKALANDIVQGVLPPETQLPTHRELADKLRVGVGTVTRAYALAKKRGLIMSTVGRGTFVAFERQVGSGSGATIDLSQNFVRGEQFTHMLRAAVGGRSDPHLYASLLDSDQSGAGSEEHRAAAAKWFSRPDFLIRPEQVVLCNGAQHAIMALAALHSQKGDTILTEELTYAGIKGVAGLLGLRLEGVRLTAEGLDPGDLKRLAGKRSRILYITPTLHNPTGATMPARRRRQIAEIARAKDLTIIEDDVYGFIAPDSPAPLASFAPERTYYIAGTSKSLASGLRLGIIVCPADAVQRVAAAVRATIWETPPIMAALAARWFGDGTATAMVEWKRKEVRDRYAIAVDILGGFLRRPSAICPHLWISLPESWRPDQFVFEARGRGVLISPADAFAVTRRSASAFRVCIGAVARRDQLEAGLRTLRGLLSGPPNTGFDVI